MPGAHDTCGPMHVQAGVAFRGKLRFARVEAHAHMHHRALWEGVADEGTLGSDGCRDRIAGASKGHEEGIPLRVDLMAAMLAECGTQEVSALAQQASIVLTQLLEQLRGSLDI